MLHAKFWLAAILAALGTLGVDASVSAHVPAQVEVEAQGEDVKVVGAQNEDPVVPLVADEDVWGEEGAKNALLSLSEERVVRVPIFGVKTFIASLVMFALLVMMIWNDDEDEKDERWFAKIGDYLRDGLDNGSKWVGEKFLPEKLQIDGQSIFVALMLALFQSGLAELVMSAFRRFTTKVPGIMDGLPPMRGGFLLGLGALLTVALPIMNRQTLGLSGRKDFQPLVFTVTMAILGGVMLLLSHKQRARYTRDTEKRVARLSQEDASLDVGVEEQVSGLPKADE